MRSICRHVVVLGAPLIYGKDEDEVLAKEEEHARADHNMTMIPTDTIKEMANHIRDGAAPRRRWFGVRKAG